MVAVTRHISLCSLFVILLNEILSLAQEHSMENEVNIDHWRSIYNTDHMQHKVEA